MVSSDAPTALNVPINTPQLQASIWKQWSVIMKLVLRAENLWAIVDGTRRRPAVNDNPPVSTFQVNQKNYEAAKRAEQESWDAQEAKAQLYIHNYAGVFADRLTDKYDVLTSKIAWKLLEKLATEKRAKPVSGQEVDEEWQIEN